MIFLCLCILGNQLDATLDLSWPDTLETARAGLEDISTEKLPPLSWKQTELAMEILKILFNITFDTTRRKVDEVLTKIPFQEVFILILTYFSCCYYTNFVNCFSA